MTTPIKIDFVSDVSCPWCAIGLKSLQIALKRLHDEIQAEIHFQPFELNPDMPAEGQEINEHLSQKYGSTPEQLQQAREAIRQRGAALGFEFGIGKRDRIYNTFDAHRLLHWAGREGPPGSQQALKTALFSAYFTEGLSPASHEVLLQKSREVGLDPVRGAAVLDGDTFADEVRQTENFYTSHGIHSIPAVILNGQHLISGGQPPEVFEQALRQLASKPVL
ncbi:DsbA family oxidoreductase [Rhodoferax sp.]|uniref:DsbA family oxidoreductase n=1 Tax=Rhodoferax sp. TaxID=50421 RepID=UPI0028503C08|nr:DsbA family oxidoreductase [Rhodoferax sp.]MDR3371946.1 DsbA family oxidoreductase [Rhodoferax sp.]